MSEKKRMTHPDIEGAEIWASDRTRPSREAAGWVLNEPAEASTSTTKKAPSAPKES